MENDLKIFIVIRLQQEIILYGENFSPTRIIFQYTKASSKSYKLKASIAPNMADLIIFLDDNKKLSVYTGGNIHGI